MNLVEDDALPGLALAFNPGRLGLPEAELLKLRYKPGASCLLLYGRPSAVPSRPLYYMKVFTPARARVAAAKWASRPDRSEGSVATTLDFREHGILVFGFPNDARMRRLPHLVDAKRLKRDVAHTCPELLSNGERVSGKQTLIEVLRYKPERRAVARLDFGLVDERTGSRRRRLLFGKQYGDRSPAEVAARLEEVGRKARGFLVTRVAGVSAVTGTIFLEAARGDSLCASLESPSPSPSGPFRAAGAALAAFHRSSLQFPRRRDGRVADRGLVDAACVISRLLPAERDRVLALGRRLSAMRREPRSAVPIHGDFYDRQVFVNGDEVTLLDLDEAAMGDGADDLANALAHLDLRVAQGTLPPERAAAAGRALIEGYGARPRKPAVAAALFRLVESPFREASPRAPDVARDLLSITEEAIAGSGIDD